MVTAVSTFCLSYLALFAPGINYGPRIASFIDTGLLEEADDWPVAGYPLEVAAASHQGPSFHEHCRYCCCAKVGDGRLLFDCKPGFDFRPRAPP
jgi:hypothetical protein